MRTFVLVADEASFSRAADRGHVVQSAVSATIRALEQELEVRLFDRTGRRVELTDAGRVLLPAARTALAAASAARDAVDELRGGVRGTVRLGVMQAQRAPEVGVPRLLSVFGAEHPHVHVELHRGTSAGHAEDLRNGRLDLAYVALPRGAGARIELAVLSSHEMVLLVPSRHRLAARVDVELGELADERFVDGPPEWGLRISNDRAFVSANATREVAYAVGDTQSLVEFVHYGLAVAILPAFVVGPQDDVRCVPIRHHAPSFTTAIARSADRELGAAARALLDDACRLAVAS